MSNIRLRTQDPVEQFQSTRGVRQRAVRAHLLERLTETQYRRVALLYGFDGPEMSQRAVARAEDVTHRAVQKSEQQVLDKLRQDWRMWLLWLMIAAGKFFPVADLVYSEAMRQARKPTRQEEDEMKNRGFTEIELRDDGTRWASDEFLPYPSESENEAYGSGWIAQNENGDEAENPYRSPELREAWDRGFEDAIEQNTGSPTSVE